MFENQPLPKEPPKVGLVVPSKNVSSIREAGATLSPLEQMIAGDTMFDFPWFYWAVYHHSVLEKALTDNSHLDEGQTRYGGNNEVSFPDPFYLLNMLANVTEHNQLFTTVLVSHYYHTAQLARQTADLANQSNGRLVLGLGAGNSQQETLAHRGEGFFERRGRFTDDQIPALEMMLTGKPVNLSLGQGDEIYHNMGIHPGTKHRVPIGVGGLSGSYQNGAAIERAARFGNGWFAMGNVGLFRDKLPILKHFLTKYGRTLNDFMLMGRVRLADLSMRQAVNNYVEWMDAGATHITTTTSINDPVEAKARNWSDWQKHKKVFLEFYWGTKWLFSPGKNNLFELFGSGWAQSESYHPKTVQSGYFYEPDHDREAFKLALDQFQVQRYLENNGFTSVDATGIPKENITMLEFSELPLKITKVMRSPNGEKIWFLQPIDQFEQIKHQGDLSEPEHCVIVYDAKIGKNHHLSSQKV